MKKEILKPNWYELTAELGNFLRRRGSDETYGPTTMAVYVDKVDDYEEAPLKLSTQAEEHRKYCERARRLIAEKYDTEKEREITREALAVMLSPRTLDTDSETDTSAIDRFMEYNEYVESCKQKAKTMEEENVFLQDTYN